METKQYAGVSMADLEALLTLMNSKNEKLCFIAAEFILEAWFAQQKSKD